MTLMHAILIAYDHEVQLENDLKIFTPILAWLVFRISLECSIISNEAFALQQNPSWRSNADMSMSTDLYKLNGNTECVTVVS